MGVGILRDGERIHVGAQEHGRSGRGAIEHGSEPVSSEVILDGIRRGPPDHVANGSRRGDLRPRGLGESMQLVAQLDEIDHGWASIG